MIVGTAGHIDHGKTTLVRALTGIDTDRLPEEKARGISIELGYAYAPLENGDALGFVDVPGHERFVHTMVAGACGIDFALLTIAADDGIMPQTREHLAILQLLGVTQGAVALTKTDRVNAARLDQVRAEVAAWLADTPLAAAPQFETNATRADDDGVARLNAYLRETAATCRKRRDDGLFRLAVDRIFTLPGQGTIVAGTVFAGQINVGDSVRLAPAGKSARVRSVHAQNRAADIGRAGQRCALNLAGIDKEAIQRGDWIVDSRLTESSERLDAEMTLLPDAGITLRHWTPLHVHLGTAHHVAHVALLEGDTLASGQAARVQLIFDRPVCALPGDRFIVRNAQASRTVGGGQVLDPFGPARKRRTPQRHAWLDALRRWLDARDIEPLLAQAPHGMPHSTLMHLTGLPAHALTLPADAIEIALPGKTGEDAVVILRRNWDHLRNQIVAVLERFHAQQPDEQGPDSARLRRIAAPLLHRTLWRALVDALIADGLVAQSGPWLHLPSHTVSLDVAEETLSQALLPLIRQGRFDPPWVRDLVASVREPEDRVRQVLRKLARQGQVYQVVRDLFYHRDTIVELAQLIAELAREHGNAVNASTFRDATGLGRKRAIQVLEFFDRVGYTRFQHDIHYLRTDSRLHDLLEARW